MAVSRSLRELASLAGGRVVGDGDVRIERVSSVDEAGDGALTFAVDAHWIQKALASRASAVIVPSATTIESSDKSLLAVDDVRAAPSIVR